MQSMTASLHGGVVLKPPSRSAGFLPVPPAATGLGFHVNNASYPVRNGNNINIWCSHINKHRPIRRPDEGGGIFLNAKSALQALLSLSLSDSTQIQPFGQCLPDVKTEKKRAVRCIIEGRREEAKKMMEDVYGRYKGRKPVVNEY